MGEPLGETEDNSVYLNVYDLTPAVSIPNALLNNEVVRCLGAFHAAVEVYGQEFSFSRTVEPKDCGIFQSRKPRVNKRYVFRESVLLGETDIGHWEFWMLLRDELAPLWSGGSYHPLHNNCIHFCEVVLEVLGVNSVPGWVRGLHETGASLSKMTARVVQAAGTDLICLGLTEKNFCVNDISDEASLLDFMQGPAARREPKILSEAVPS